VQQPVYQPEPSYPQHQAYQPEQAPVQQPVYQPESPAPAVTPELRRKR
jgi:S-DNA-T family DNA segregation ATPase FtsK/SpoIIIE